MELDVLRSEPAARTEVGSYFVANYPPFSVWSREQTPAALDVLDRAADDGGGGAAAAPPPLGLYLHIPFCRKRCKFCYFRVYTDKNGGEIDTYMDALAREIALYKQRPRLAGRQFDFVYFGGGTPSYLSNEQLKRLVERINDHWRWEAAREVTFECEPGTLKLSKLQTIRGIGVTRLSLGIEHWADEILESNGRAHRSREIAVAYEWAREVGFAQINVDLIAGMVGETEDKWKMAVERTLALAPDSLTIYQMELPFNTVFSREAGAAAAPLVADWATKRRWVDYAFSQFEAQGYRVSSGYTLVRPGPHSSFVYRDALWRGGDMVGTGVASFSYVGGAHFQNEDKWDAYLGRVQAGELPLSRALLATPRQRLIRELVLQLKLGAIDAGYFRTRFGVEIASEFRSALATLAESQMAVVEGDCVRLTRPGLLRVDALLSNFFEPQHRNIRYT